MCLSPFLQGAGDMVAGEQLSPECPSRGQGQSGIRSLYGIVILFASSNLIGLFPQCLQSSGDRVLLSYHVTRGRRKARFSVLMESVKLSLRSPPRLSGRHS